MAVSKPLNLYNNLLPHPDLPGDLVVGFGVGVFGGDAGSDAPYTGCIESV